MANLPTNSEEQSGKVNRVSQGKMKKVTGKNGNHLGAIKINNDGTYQIYLPRYPLEAVDSKVVDYMGMRTGFSKTGIAMNLLEYGKLHEENHIPVHYAKGKGMTEDDEEFMTEFETLRSLKLDKGSGIYAVALVLNAYDYLSGNAVAKDLAEMFPDIKEEAGTLKKYIKPGNYKSLEFRC